MVDVTANYGLIKPEFDASIWHDEVNGNFDQLDSILFAAIGFGNLVGQWTNSTFYTEGQRVFDPDDGTIWNCNVDHASAATDTFAEDRADNPSYWNSVSTLPFVRGAWTPETVYASGDVAYDNSESLFGIAAVTHTSSAAPNNMRDDIANWSIIADLSALAVAVGSVNGETGTVILTSDDISDSGQTNQWATAAELTQIADHETDIATLQSDIAALQATIAGYGDIVTKSVASVLPVGLVFPWTATTAPTTTNGNGTTPAWLVCKGGTIGNGSSGGTLRANADMSDLFVHLWTNFGNTELPIQDSAGAGTTRGGSAAADFAANKRLPVLNIQGDTIYFADNSRGKITVTGHSTNGAQVGQQNKAILQANLPSLTWPDTLDGVLDSTSITNGSNVVRNFSESTNNNSQSGGGANIVNTISYDEDNLAIANSGVSITGSVTSGGSGTALDTLSPGIVMPTAIIKT